MAAIVSPLACFEKPSLWCGTPETSDHDGVSLSGTCRILLAWPGNTPSYSLEDFGQAAPLVACRSADPPVIVNALQTLLKALKVLTFIA